MAPKKEHKNETPKGNAHSDTESHESREVERKKPVPKRQAKKSAPQLRADNQAAMESAMLLKNALARSTTPPQQSQHTPFTPSPAPYMPEWCELVLKANYDAEGIPERYRNYPSVIKCKECSKPGKPSLLTSHDSSNLRKHKRLHRVKPSTAPSDTEENETFDLSVVISARSLAESCVTAGLNFAQAENVARVHNRIIDRREISLEADRMIKNFDEWLRGYLAGQHFFPSASTEVLPKASATMY